MRRVRHLALFLFIVAGACNRSAPSTGSAAAPPASAPVPASSATIPGTPTPPAETPREPATHASALLRAPTKDVALDPAAPLLDALDVKNDLGCGCTYISPGDPEGRPVLLFESPSIVLLRVRGRNLSLPRTGGEKDRTGSPQGTEHVYEYEGIRIDVSQEFPPSDCDHDESCDSAPSHVVIRAIQGTATMSLRGTGECGC